jgi:hypothetical protein
MTQIQQSLPRSVKSVTAQGPSNVVPSGVGLMPTNLTTGPKAGTALQTIGTGTGQVSSGAGWSYSATNQAVSITGESAVFDGYLVTNIGVNVYANKVLIQNCQINAGGEDGYPIRIMYDQNLPSDPAYITNAITHLTVQNCTISGFDNNRNRAAACIKDIYGYATGILIQGNNLYWTENGVQVYAGIVQNNFIHDLVDNTTYRDHVNGIITSGSTFLMIQHNTILNPNSQTDCVVLAQSTTAASNKTVNNNLLAGGGYAVYGGDAQIGTTSNIKITNNQFSTLFFAECGAFGPATAFTLANAGNTWSGNVWHETGAAMPAP